MQRDQQIKKQLGIVGSDLKFNIYSTNDTKIYEVVRVKDRKEVETEFLHVDNIFEDKVPYYVRNAIRSHYYMNGVG